MRGVMIIGIVIGFLVQVGMASAATPISSCGTISSSGVYELQNDIINSSVWRCINITSSDIIFDGQGHTIDGIDSSSQGVRVTGAATLTNITVKNLTVTDWLTGILYLSVDNGDIADSIASSNRYGIYLSSSSSNALTDNIANSNSYYGITLAGLSNSNTLTGNTASNNYYGIYLDNSSSNTLTGNTANSNNNRGIYLSSSSNYNTLTGNTASSNNYQGIFLSSSTGNTLTGNTAQENAWFDFYIWTSTDADCNNGISGMTVSGGRSFLYYNSQTSLSNAVASELVLCNADNSNIDNVTIMGSDVLDNNGILLVRTDSATISNSNSSNNIFGIDIEQSSGNTITGNTVSSNSRDGIYIYNSSNTVTGNTATSNAMRGISIESSSGNTITNNNASSNNRGINLLYSSGNTLTDNTANSNTYQGVYLDLSGSNTLTGNTMSLNTYNFWIDGSAVSDFVQTIYASNTVDGKPMHYHVGISNAVMDSSSGAGYIGIVNGNNVTIKDLTLTKNGAGVLFVSTSNSLIENVTVLNNYGGIYLAGSNSNTLTKNTANSNMQYGIYLRNSASVITDNIVNSNGDIGIDLYNSNGSTITDNTANNNTRRGINLWDSSSNTITGNNASLNNRGINLASSSNSNTLTGNTANLNTYYGILLESSNGSALTGNTINSNGLYGIYLESSNGNTITNNIANSNAQRGISLRASDSNTVTDNTANLNNRGINVVASSNYNTITGNNASSNTYQGINLGSSTGNTFTDNTAQENTYYDFYVWANTDAGCNNEISGMTISGGRSFLYYNSSVSLYDTVASELVLCNADYSDVNNVTVMGSDVLDNNGILMVRTDFTNISDSSSSNNTYGIDLLSSSNNTLKGNTVSSNSYGGFYLLYGSSDNLIYNNYLDNVNNAYDDGINDWNTTKTAGTNIIGGTFLGGNYWSDYTGSDTDSDGIGDTALPYNAGGNITNAGDWLPLTLPSSQTTFNITLLQGWNLISIPLVQENTSLDAVLASIDGNYTAVYAWIDGSWKWSTALFNPLTEMDLEHGYWINMTAPDILELSGTVPASTTINISTGWNLVGYPSITTQNLTDVLSSINYTGVYAWIDGAWKWSTALFNPLTEMSPGYGYWINATDVGSYEVGN